MLSIAGKYFISGDREHIIDEVRKHYSALHVLVNNGIAPKFVTIYSKQQKKVLTMLFLSISGTYFLMQRAVNWMIEQKKNDETFTGCIINISSMSATVASVNRGEYCISKAGLSMATQLFAVRLGEFNIPVYEIRPGIIRTDMTAGVKEKYDKLISEGLLVQKRWGESEDVGKVVSSLANGNFAYSTGQVIMVDGGLTIPRL